MTEKLDLEESMFSRRTLIAGIALGVIIVATPAYTQDKSIVVASTTSTEGLMVCRGFG